MATITVKCISCKNTKDKQECTQVGNRRYVCNECYDSYIAEQSVKQQSQQREADAYKDLIAYICELFQIKAPTMVMVTQIKRFKENYNYTYQGMKATLNYFFELQGNSVEDSMGVGIIPYVYDETRAFYDVKKQSQEALSKIDSIDKVNVITIQESDTYDFNTDDNLIDISLIGCDDGE